MPTEMPPTQRVVVKIQMTPRVELLLQITLKLCCLYQVKAIASLLPWPSSQDGDSRDHRSTEHQAWPSGWVAVADCPSHKGTAGTAGAQGFLYYAGQGPERWPTGKRGPLGGDKGKDKIASGEEKGCAMGVWGQSSQAWIWGSGGTGIIAQVPTGSECLHKIY